MPACLWPHPAAPYQDRCEGNTEQSERRYVSGAPASAWKTASRRPPGKKNSSPMLAAPLQAQQAKPLPAGVHMSGRRRLLACRGLDGRAAQKQRNETDRFPTRTEDPSRRRHKSLAAGGACMPLSRLALVTTTLLVACVSRASLPSAYVAHARAPPSVCPLPCVRVRPCEVGSLYAAIRIPTTCW